MLVASKNTIDIDIIAHDYATSAFRAAEIESKMFVSSMSRLTTGLHNGFGKANYAFRTFSNAMRGVNNTVVGAMKTAGQAVYNFTKDSIQQFAELENVMARTMGVLATNYNFNWGNIKSGTATPSDRAEYARFQQDYSAMTEQTYRLATYGPTNMGSLYNPAEIAQAQMELAKGGITAEQMLANDDKLVKDVTIFAGANGLDMADAVSYGIQLAAQYEKGTDDWGEMFDKVTWAANQTPNTGVEDMMQALQKVGNVAHGYGISLDDTLVSLIIMGHSGLRGSQAGAGLATTLTRGISPTGISTAGAPPTKNVENLYNQFKDTITDKDGNFIGMDSYIDELSNIENQLSDKEKAWFNKKLFGLYQTKTALALSKNLGGDTDGANVFARLIAQMDAQSDESNQLIYDMILESSGGHLEALKNVWDATKMQVGDALSPVTKAVTKELIKGLQTGDFSNFNWDNIRAAIDEASENLKGLFGEDAGELITKISEWAKAIGEFLVNAGQIAGTEAPLLGGTVDAAIKLLNGDFFGAWEAFQKGLDDTNEAIDGLPEDLQEAAKAVRNLIIAIELLLGLNVVSKVGEFVTAIGSAIFALKMFNGVKAIKNAVTGTANANINASMAQVNTGTTQFGTVGNMTVASAPLINITASVVNVYGGIVNGGGGSSGMGGGNPMLPSGGGTPMLPSGGTPVLPGISPTPMLPAAGGGSGIWTAIGGGALGFGLGEGAAFNFLTGGGAAAMLPGATGSAAMLPEAAEIIELVEGADGVWSMAGGGVGAGSSVLGTVSKAIPYIAAFAALAPLFVTTAGVVDSHGETASHWLQGYNEGLRGEDLHQYLYQDSNYIEGVRVGSDDIIYDEEWLPNFEKFMAFATSTEGMQKFYEMLMGTTPGGITEKLLQNFFDEQGLSTKGQLGQWMVTYLLNSMGVGEYESPSRYQDNFAEDSINKFVDSHLKDFDESEWAGRGTIAQVTAIIAGKLDGLKYVQGTADIYTNQYGEYFKFLSDGTLQNVSSELNAALSNMHVTGLSLQDAVNALINSGMTKNEAINVVAESLNIDPTLLSTLSSMNISLDSLVQAVASGISDPELKQAFLDAWANFESTIQGDMETVSGNVISISDAVRMLASDPNFQTAVGTGPIPGSSYIPSADKTYDYVMGKIADGELLNNGLLTNILNGITALDPTLTVDVINTSPTVNVDVDVKVDQAGNVTKNIITSYGALDNWVYRQSQRYGSTVTVQR